MKKLFSFIIMPLMFMFVVWIIVFMTTYDSIENLTQYHLDLGAMFKRFGTGTNINYGFQSTFRSFLDTMKFIVNQGGVVSTLTNNSLDSSNGWTIVLQGVEALVNPIKSIALPVVVFGYLIALVCQLLIIISVVATAIFDFIFSPIFIHV